jgi:polysaccharide biosynthesis/export protein
MVFFPDGIDWARARTDPAKRMNPIDAFISARRAASLLGCLLLATLTSCTTPGTPMPELAKEINATRQGGPTRFVPGDRISLMFAHDPLLNQKVDVRPDGSASFLMVGDFAVAGKTPEEFTKELTTAYASKLKAPDLVANIESQGENTSRESPRRYFVLGEVRTPGSFFYTGDEITIPKALALANGFDKATASLESVLLVRWLPSEKGYHGWKINAGIDYWSSPEQIFLQAGDVLYVPNTTIDKVNIWVDQYIRKLIPFPYLSYYIVNQPPTPTN